jgi:hypothetical protein
MAINNNDVISDNDNADKKGNNNFLRGNAKGGSRNDNVPRISKDPAVEKFYQIFAMGNPLSFYCQIFCYIKYRWR